MLHLCCKNDYSELLKFFFDKISHRKDIERISCKDVWDMNMESCPKMKKLLLEDKSLWKTLPEWKMFSESVEGDCASLRAEVAQLRKMVELIWYSPGMPGCMMAKEDFEEFITSGKLVVL
jgi:hypothetical protein